MRDPSFLLQPTYVLVDWIIPGPLAPLDHYRVLCPMWVQVRAAWVDHLVVVSEVSPKLLDLTLCHPSAADILVHSRRHGRALLQESVVDFSRGYWHRKEHTRLVVVIVVLEVLQHE